MCSIIIPPYIVWAGYFVYCSFAFQSFCTVTDFSAGALRIGVKFYAAVRPHLRQVFSHSGGIARRMAEGRV